MSHTSTKWVLSMSTVGIFAILAVFALAHDTAIEKEATAIRGASIWVERANSYTTNEYGFHMSESQVGKFVGDFVCNKSAPKNPNETPDGQYTYCQNGGQPIKVALAWKELALKKEIVLARIANTISEYTKKEGEYLCREDRSVAHEGVISDCVVTMDDGSMYYASAYFFYPDNTSGLSQVAYAYSITSDSESAVRLAVREIAKGVRIEEEISFKIPTFIRVAYAQDGGDTGGGDGGGDTGGGCGCDGSGDTGGGTGGGEGGSPGDSGPGGGGDGGGGGGDPLPGDPLDPGTGGGNPSNPGGGSENRAPVAYAGPDIYLSPGVTSVRITEAYAYDPDGPMPIVRWLRVSGPASLMANGGSVSPTISRLVIPGIYVFTLVASDEIGEMDSDSMRIIVGMPEPDPEDEGGGSEGVGGGDDSGSDTPGDNPPPPGGDDTEDHSGGGPGGGSGGGGGGGGGSGSDDDDEDVAGGDPSDISVPDLRVDKAPVHRDSGVVLSWDTNNGDEGRCTLTGGSLGTMTLPREGHVEIGSRNTIVRGKTTYTLDCEGRRDSVTVDIIPEIRES